MSCKRLTENLNELLGQPNSLVFHISTNLRAYKAIFIPLQLGACGGRQALNRTLLPWKGGVLVPFVKQANFLPVLPVWWPGATRTVYM